MPVSRAPGVGGSRGWRGPPPAPEDLAVPDATAGKCVRHLRKSLLYFHKVIITDACHGLSSLERYLPLGPWGGLAGGDGGDWARPGLSVFSAFPAPLSLDPLPIPSWEMKTQTWPQP